MTKAPQQALHVADVKVGDTVYAGGWWGLAPMRLKGQVTAIKFNRIVQMLIGDEHVAFVERGGKPLVPARRDPSYPATWLYADSPQARTAYQEDQRTRAQIMADRMAAEAAHADSLAQAEAADRAAFEEQNPTWRERVQRDGAIWTVNITVAGRCVHAAAVVYDAATYVNYEKVRGYKAECAGLVPIDRASRMASGWHEDRQGAFEHAVFALWRSMTSEVIWISGWLGEVANVAV